MRKLFFVIIIVSTIFNISWSQNINRAGTSAAQFLKFGVGARASAMGEAGVTLTNESPDSTGIHRELPVLENPR